MWVAGILVVVQYEYLWKFVVPKHGAIARGVRFFPREKQIPRR